jgi:peroxiredoxin
MITTGFNSRILRSCLLIPGFCLLLLAACGRRTAEPPPPPPPPVNDLVLRNLADEFPGEIQTADFAGQVQLLVFFRTDDAPSRATIPEWNALQTDYADRGFTVVGLAADPRPAAAIAQETASLGAAFPVGLADIPTIAAFGGPDAIRAIPTAFLLDRNGAIARAYAGFQPWPILRADIDAALDGLPLPSLAKDDEPEPAAD